MSLTILESCTQVLNVCPPSVFAGEVWGSGGLSFTELLLRDTTDRLRINIACCFGIWSDWSWMQDESLVYHAEFES